MTNLEGKFRTNFFHVVNERRYAQILAGLGTCDIQTFDKKDEDGNILHAFGAYTSLDYFPAASFYEEIREKTDLFSENGTPVSRSNMDDYEELFDKNCEVVFSRYEGQPNLDDFIEQIQKILPDKECFAMIMTESEGLNYIKTYAMFVTRETVSSMDLDRWLRDKAIEMFGTSMKNSCACQW